MNHKPLYHLLWTDTIQPILLSKRVDLLKSKYSLLLLLIKNIQVYQSVLIIIYDLVIMDCHSEYSVTRVNDCKGSKTRSNVDYIGRHFGRQGLEIVGSHYADLIIMGMGKELPFHSVLVSFNNNGVSVLPVMVTPFIAGWNVACYENRFMVVFTIL